MKTLELYIPLKKCQTAQPFGENANGSYAANGLKGHTGIDLVSFWGDIEMVAAPGIVYKAINFDNANLGFYRAVFTIVETNDAVYEVSYGHCKSFLSVLGKSVVVGDPLATEGNTGEVFVGGGLAGPIEVTNAEKNAGSQAGTHLHFQVRLCEKVQEVDMHELANGHYLIAQNGSNPYQDSDGNFFHVINYDNGYNGCIDPQPFMLPIAANEANTAAAIVQTSSDVIQHIAESQTLSHDQKLNFLKWIEDAIKGLFGVK